MGSTYMCKCKCEDVSDGAHRAWYKKRKGETGKDSREMKT